MEHEIKNTEQTFEEGRKVELVIGGMTDLGYNALIDGVCEGLLYKNEIFQTLRKGQRIEGYIKKIREDGRIDLCLQKPGTEKVDHVAELLLRMLNEQGGAVAIDDKSPPEVIYRMFGASKKTFKKAVGALYKKRLILLEDGGIRLVN